MLNFYTFTIIFNSIVKLLDIIQFSFGCQPITMVDVLKGNIMGIHLTLAQRDIISTNPNEKSLTFVILFS